MDSAAARKARNRESAAASRERARVHTLALESEVAKLTAELARARTASARVVCECGRAALGTAAVAPSLSASGAFICFCSCCFGVGRRLHTRACEVSLGSASDLVENARHSFLLHLASPLPLQAVLDRQPLLHAHALVLCALWIIWIMCAMTTDTTMPT